MFKRYDRTDQEHLTALLGGVPITKAAVRVEEYGEVDELNCHVGWVRTLLEKNGQRDLLDKVIVIQQELFQIGSSLATAPGVTIPGLCSIDLAAITRLEDWIENVHSLLTPIHTFVLPGGTELNAALHLARAVCRRVERRVVALADQGANAQLAIRYLNRLSDLFFLMARLESQRAKVAEYPWTGCRNKNQEQKN